VFTFHEYWKVDLLMMKRINPVFYQIKFCAMSLDAKLSMRAINLRQRERSSISKLYSPRVQPWGLSATGIYTALRSPALSDVVLEVGIDIWPEYSHDRDGEENWCRQDPQGGRQPAAQ
jgi:hypothetical protein